MSVLALLLLFVVGVSPGGAQTLVPREAPAELPLLGDWDGDGETDVGLLVSDPEPILLLCKGVPNPTPCSKHRLPKALRDLTPTAFDWDGDGRDEPILFVPSVPWLLLFDLPAEGTLRFAGFHRIAGGEWNQLLSGDWDGDRKVDLALTRKGTGRFRVFRNPFGGHTSATAFTFRGVEPGWYPVAGDWDGDGRDSLGFYDAAAETVHVRDTLTSGAAEGEVRLQSIDLGSVLLLCENGSRGLSCWLYNPQGKYFVVYETARGLPLITVIIPTDPDGAN